jgi:flagellin
LDDVLTRAKFNSLEVLNGDLSGVTLMVGANASDTITLAVGTVSHGLANISDALSTIDSALDTVNTTLADIGAYQSRLEKTMDTAMAIEEAQWAARGRIVDADFARETSRMTSAQIIQQAGVSALAQANQIPQLALGLLG